MFQIKICGITSPNDARVAVEAGADAIGLNFYDKSPRHVTVAAAADIARSVPGDVTIVGVFVNATAERIAKITGEVGLDAVQLHGDEPPELIAELGEDFRIVRARRLSPRGLAEIAEDLNACAKRGSRRPDAVLLDANVTGQYGGTGSKLPWSNLTDYCRWLDPTPMILAGGLRPENVAEAIGLVRPSGVDVASGVEDAPGVKSPEKMRLFIQAAREAFASAD